jgi:hypothetical protein
MRIGETGGPIADISLVSIARAPSREGSGVKVTSDGGEPRVNRRCTAPRRSDRVSIPLVEADGERSSRFCLGGRTLLSQAYRGRLRVSNALAG